MSWSHVSEWARNPAKDYVGDTSAEQHGVESVIIEWRLPFQFTIHSVNMSKCPWATHRTPKWWVHSCQWIPNSKFRYFTFTHVCSFVRKVECDSVKSPQKVKETWKRIMQVPLPFPRVTQAHDWTNMKHSKSLRSHMRAT